MLCAIDVDDGRRRKEGEGPDLCSFETNETNNTQPGSEQIRRVAKSHSFFRPDTCTFKASNIQLL